MFSTLREEEGSRIFDVMLWDFFLRSKNKDLGLPKFRVTARSLSTSKLVEAGS